LHFLTFWANRYVRIIALVYLPDSTLLNTELLKAGLARHYTYFDKNPAWKKLEQQAQRNKIGL
jgi:endonuclease YncB( thermonuclease family)